MDATTLTLTLYSRKRDLLAAKLAVVLAQQQNGTLKEPLPSNDRNHTRRTHSSKPSGHRVFSDWLELRDSIKLDDSRFKFDAASIDGRDADDEGDLVQMIALHANPKPMGRSPHPSNPHKTSFDRDAPLLQFIAVMERKTSTLHLYHPVTHELVCQSMLPEIRDVAAFSIASDRRSHLAILARSGRLALYNLRIWHHGRAISGGFRRVDPLGTHQCSRDSYDSLLDRPGLSWWPSAPQTSPAPGKNLHIDFELVFRTPVTQSMSKSIDHPTQRTFALPVDNDRPWGGNVVVTGRFRHNFAIASDSNGTLSFFHTENGTFAGDLVVDPSRQPIKQFEPMAGGILALAIRNQVHFVDVASRRVVGAVCDAPASQTITSLKADPASPFTIYAGLSDGRGLVFRLRQVSMSWRSQSDEEPARDRPECVLVGQLRPRRQWIQQNPKGADKAMDQARLMTKTAIDVLPGYLVMSTGSRLVLFQLTTGESSRPVYLSERDLGYPASRYHDSNARIVAISAGANVAEHPAALVVHVATWSSASHGSVRHRLDVYASLQPPLPPSSLNLNWVRFPVVLICVVAALFWQQRAKAGPHVHHEDGFPAELFNTSRVDWSKSTFFTNQRARRRF